MSFWNLFYFTSGIYVAQKYPKSIPDIKSKIDEIANTIIANNNWSYQDILKIISK